MGHVTFVSRWASDDNATQIDLVCRGEDYKISLGVIYTSAKFHSLIDAKEEDRNAKGF